MSLSLFRHSLRLTAIYATVCVLWGGFGHWFAPSIIAAAYDNRNQLILNRLFGNRSLPVEHYVGRWSIFATATMLAAIFHLFMVLLIRAIDHKRRDQILDHARAASGVNFILTLFCGAFLAWAVLSGVHGEAYKAYLEEWMNVLGGHDPWLINPDTAYNAYGPMFNILAPLVLLNPLTNKLLFASAYLFS
jgi:hypothetical protein